MIAEMLLGSLVGLGVNEVYKAARRAYDRARGKKGDREILEDIAAALDALQQATPGPVATAAATGGLAARTLAGEAARITGAITALPSARQGAVSECVVHDVVERARETIEREGPERASGATLVVQLPRPAEDLTGSTLSGYRIESVLGTGGFGTVYLGRNPAGMVAAIKVPHHAGQVRRVLKEAGALARLSHPGIVTLKHLAYDHPTHPHLVFEHVEGRTLRELLTDEGPLDERLVEAILRQVLEALDHAHGLGVLHLDLKPDNLIMTGTPPQVAVKVLDFGIGRLTAQTQVTLALSAGVTGAAIAGTPAYMAPEQIAAAPDLDARADLYALAVTVYELVTGRPPVGNARLRANSQLLVRFFEQANVSERDERLRSVSDGLRLMNAPRPAEVQPGREGEDAREPARTLPLPPAPVGGATRPPLLSFRWILAGLIAFAVGIGLIVVLTRLGAPNSLLMAIIPLGLGCAFWGLLAMAGAYREQ